MFVDEDGAPKRTPDKRNVVQKLLQNKYIVALVIGLLDMIRVHYSMNPHFYKDIDYHCYKAFADKLLAGERNYAYVSCDHGLNYYPAVNSIFYMILFYVTGGSELLLQQYHAIVFVTCTILSIVLFYDLMIDKHESFKKTCLRFAFLLSTVLLTQTIYRVAISYIQNDLHMVPLLLLMMYGIRYEHYWLSSLMYTCAVGFKMNSLFYGPALLLLYLRSIPFISYVFSLRFSYKVRVILHFAFMGLFQVAIATPFLLRDFMSYARIAFNFSRDFDHQTNMAWTFIGDSLRHDPMFYKLLLVSTVVLLFCFLYVCDKVLLAAKLEKNSLAVAKWKLFMLVASQFVAFCFSRGLHVQFSLWIFFSLPFLLATLLDTEYSPASIYGIVIGAYYLFDWCLSAPRSVLHLSALFTMASHFLNGNVGDAVKYVKSIDQSLFGKVGNYTHVWLLAQEQQAGVEKTFYKINGHYYEETYSATVIPASFILFVMECMLLIKLFALCKAMLERFAKQDKKYA